MCVKFAMSGEQYREAAQELVGTRKAANAFSATSVDAVAPDAGVFKIGSDGSAGSALRQAYSIAVGMGNLDAGQVSVSLSGSAASQAQRADDEREKKSKRDYEEQMFQSMLQRAQDWSDRLGRDIDGMEAEFTREYGDAWREHMALEILDPETAQRREGESVAEYRARLEEELRREMVNDDGSIKDEYRTGPHTRWARWAQSEDQKREVDHFIARQNDESIPEEVRAQEQQQFASSATFAQLTDGDARLAGAGQTNNALDQTANAQTDARLTVATAAATDASSLNSI
jgi:hypothetical protein